MPEIRGSDEVFVGSVRDTNADAHAPAAIKADDEILEDACDREAFVKRVILVMAVAAFGLSAGSARTSRALGRLGCDATGTSLSSEKGRYRIPCLAAGRDPAELTVASGYGDAFISCS
jgi:hypothetical protein